MAIRSEKRPVEAGRDGLEALSSGYLNSGHETALVDGLRGWWGAALTLTMEHDGFWTDDDTPIDFEMTPATDMWGLVWVSALLEKGWIAIEEPLIEAEEVIAQFCAQQVGRDPVARDWLVGVAEATAMLAIGAYLSYLEYNQDTHKVEPRPIEVGCKAVASMEDAERWGRVAARWGRSIAVLACDWGRGE